MTEQHAVDEIHAAMKDDWTLVVWFRGLSGRPNKHNYDSSDVLSMLADMEALRRLARTDAAIKRLLDSLHHYALVPIDSIYRNIVVGTTRPLDEPGKWPD